MMYKILSIPVKINGYDDTSFKSTRSMTDYDIVIIDPKNVRSSLPSSNLEKDNRFHLTGKDAFQALTIIERRRSEVSALLNDGKIIVTFLEPPHEIVLDNNPHGTGCINTYSWLPHNHDRKFFGRLVNGTGREIRIIDPAHPFTPYYRAFRNEIEFTSYIDIPIDSFEGGNVFLCNGVGQIIGFSSEIGKGLVVFIPPYSKNDENNKKFIGVILSIGSKYLTGSSKSEPPDWVENYSVPGVESIEENIESIQKQVSDLQIEISDMSASKDYLEDYKLLLFEQGIPLQDKVKDTLRLMGFTADTYLGDHTEHDVILECEEGRAIAEVEGKDNDAIGKSKIDQLISAINEDSMERNGEFAKGILIRNHYRNSPPDERGDPFTETVLYLARHYKYALITTTELFNAAIYLLSTPEDEDFKKECRVAILSTEGELVTFDIP